MSSLVIDQANRLRIVVLGYLVRGPLGGLAWHHLQYVMGLARLGHDVYFLEDSDDYPSCYDPERHVVDTRAEYGLRFAESVLARLGLAERWAYYDAHAARWCGPLADRGERLCRSADLCLNLSGVNRLRTWTEAIPVRAFVDTDPVFTQIRHLTDSHARELAEQHTCWFSFAENLGTLSYHVPDDGFRWKPTRQPLVLDAWPLTPIPPEGRLTAVMQWESYSAREYEGKRYGMKSESFAEYLDLPQSSPLEIELAVGSENAPRDMLQARGWRIADPLLVTRTPWTYQAYIQRSLGEFGIAKHGYVTSQCGWFSERSAAYMASGRAVIAQDTGFSRWLPTGEGLLPFNSPEEALHAIESVKTDPRRHGAAAREIAAQYFDYRRVLPSLLEGAMQGA